MWSIGLDGRMHVPLVTVDNQLMPGPHPQLPQDLLFAPLKIVGGVGVVGRCGSAEFPENTSSQKSGQKTEGETILLVFCPVLFAAHGRQIFQRGGGRKYHMPDPFYGVTHARATSSDDPPQISTTSATLPFTATYYSH